MHTNVDPLTRTPLPICNNITVHNNWDAFKDRIVLGYRFDDYHDGLLKELQKDVKLPQLNRYTLSEDSLILYLQPGNEYYRICVPATPRTDPINLRVDIIHDHHDSNIGGHLGTTKTINAVSRGFYWQGLTKDVKGYVRSCSKCQANKPSNLLTDFINRFKSRMDDGTP